MDLAYKWEYICSISALEINRTSVFWKSQAPIGLAGFLSLQELLLRVYVSPCGTMLLNLTKFVILWYQIFMHLKYFCILIETFSSKWTSYLHSILCFLSNNWHFFSVLSTHIFISCLHYGVMIVYYNKTTFLVVLHVIQMDSSCLR